MSEPSWLSGGPDSGNAPVLGSMAANMVDSAFRVGMRSKVETNWTGTAMPISPTEMQSWGYTVEVVKKNVPGQTAL